MGCVTAPSLSEIGQGQEGALMSIIRLQAAVGGGLPADRERPRSPTAPEPARWVD